MKQQEHIKFHTRDSLYTGAKETLYKLADKLNRINILESKQELIAQIKDIKYEVDCEVEHITWAEEVIRENALAQSFGYTRCEPNCFLFEYDGHSGESISLQYKTYEAFFRCRIYNNSENPLKSNPDKEWTLEVNGEKIVTSKRLLECLRTHSEVIKTVRHGIYKKILWGKVDKLQKKNGFFDLYVR